MQFIFIQHVNYIYVAQCIVSFYFVKKNYKIKINIINFFVKLVHHKHEIEV